MAAPVAAPARIVVAPDSFKGSVTAAQAAAAVARGVRSVLPDVPVVEHPIADGGEGTVDAVVRAGLRRVEATVTGPLGDRVRASYAVGDEGAVVELAAAAGLGCLPVPGPTRHTSRCATTRGVGELVRHALDGGVRQVTVAIGGSATTDGGAGLLAGLGARVTSADGTDLAAGGEALLDVASLGLGGLDPRLRETAVVVACDVDPARPPRCRGRRWRRVRPGSRPGCRPAPGNADPPGRHRFPSAPRSRRARRGR